jgi:phage baseplate assembly protein W
MNIKIKSLEIDKISEKSLNKGYLYKDISFDLQPDTYLNAQLNRKESLKDVQALYDVEAIKNSIKNIFLTAPGQKILNPRFGIDLRRFLFEPVNDFTTELITFDIEERLPDMEPRIIVRNVNVVADEENNAYSISLQIDVPSLNITGIFIKSKLDTNGYTVI